MFTDDTDSVSRLTKQILAACHGDGTGAGFTHDDILSSLANMMIFEMSVVCPTCRKKIAAKLRRDIPAWVTHAGHLAASSRARFGTSDTDSCH